MELNSIFQTYHGENETTINLMCINKKEECVWRQNDPNFMGNSVCIKQKEGLCYYSYAFVHSWREA